jgi:ubiquinone/menaquinone biosynthesis C-methylase UbiE
MNKRISSINNQVCPWWLTPTFDNPLRRWIHNPQAILGEWVREGQVVADIGCGMGYFTIPLAGMVGEGGLVIAVDLQDKMLEFVRRRAVRAGMLPRIRLHKATPELLGVTEKVDFVLTFWMVHEVPGKLEFLSQVYELLKPGGRFLLVEPIIHVPAAAFNKTGEIACSVGFKVSSMPEVRISRAVLFEKG